MNPILISLSPNTDSDDTWLALRLLFQPWRWYSGKSIEQLEGRLRSFFSGRSAITFNSGRSALVALLKAYDVGEGDDVLVQAFTCVAVPNAALWVGARPVYVDILAEDFTLDPVDLEKKITPQSKVLIIQHTFGHPAHLDDLLALAKKHNLVVIEDCAQSLGCTYKGQQLGTFGDAAILSFGRDKSVSSVFGGAALVGDPEKADKLTMFRDELPSVRLSWLWRSLLHPVAFAAILPLYNKAQIGKILLFVMQKLHLVIFPVYAEEKKTCQPTDFPRPLPNALAALAYHQFEKLPRFVESRSFFASYYKDVLDVTSLTLPVLNLSETNGALLRYTVRTPDAKALLKYAKGTDMLLGNWFQVIAPEGVDLKAAGYQLGSCPVSEKVASQVVNLPTYPRMTIDDAYRVVVMLKEFLK